MKIIAKNRRAWYDYTIEDTFEAGIVLEGSEVKSLRNLNGQIAESYVAAENGELWLINSNIDLYEYGGYTNHEPKRRRKLLMHRKEIDRITMKVKRAGYSIVPLKWYFNDRGRVKVEISLAKGKRKYDKREAEKQKSWRREKQGLLRENK